MKSLKLVLLLTIVFLSSCKMFEKKSDHSPLERQRLVVRPNEVGMLTNNVCLLRNTITDECTKWSLKVYDLADARFRKSMNDFSIACVIGGRRFHVCEKRPGYCRNQRVCLEKGRIWYKPWSKECKRSKLETEYIPAKEEHGYLIDAGAECSRDR